MQSENFTVFFVVLGDPYCAERPGRRTHGQEHHDAQGHPRSLGEEPRPRASAAPHQAEHRLRLHQRGAG